MRLITSVIRHRFRSVILLFSFVLGSFIFTSGSEVCSEVVTTESQKSGGPLVDKQLSHISSYCALTHLIA
jgi:hypothetical protein